MGSDSMLRQWFFEKIGFMTFKGFGFFAVWICLSGSLIAANFWEERFFTSWSEEEIEQMLTDSPWSRKVTVVLDESRRSQARRRAANAAGQRDDGRRIIPPSDIPPLEGIGPVPERMTLTVSWRSALPVKQALARAQAGIGEQIPAEQQAFLLQFEPLYVVSVAGVPRQFAERVKRPVLLRQTYLERPNKVPIMAEDVEAFIESEETVILEFAFLRDDPITIDDDEVWFSMTLGAVEVQRSFRPEEMMFGDSLEL
tara:strand:+ start:10974 stop:11738 length:765 start_codon:yes stop_codon:yes gene_type:complete